MDGSSGSSHSHVNTIATGGVVPVVHALDIASGLTPHTSVLLESEGGASALQSCSKGLAAGTIDGSLQLLDLRSPGGVASYMDAHSGEVLCIAAKGDILVTTGNNVPKGTTNTYPDPFLRVFDLRTMSQLPPLSPFVGHTGAAPRVVEFFPTYSSTLLIMSGNGHLVFMEATGDTRDSQFFMIPSDDSLSAPQLSAAALSSTGDVLALANGQSGSVALWGAHQSLRTTPGGQPLNRAPYPPPPPPVSLTVNDKPNPYGRYKIKTMDTTLGPDPYVTRVVCFACVSVSVSMPD